MGGRGFVMMFEWERVGDGSSLSGYGMSIRAESSFWLFPCLISFSFAYLFSRYHNLSTFLTTFSLILSTGRHSRFCYTFLFLFTISIKLHTHLSAQLDVFFSLLPDATLHCCFWYNGRFLFLGHHFSQAFSDRPILPNLTKCRLSDAQHGRDNQ
ncbi:hypothetical protein BJ165DRAFT_849388 [Panaeolus papilionaceus]|nr:hypothetical protein BJ165DRAFT_849388 [Panaeolus papilionaceus]